MNARTLVLAAAGALFVPGAAALAQIAPPPAEAPPPTELYKRPPVLVPKDTPPAESTGAKQDLPNLPYESLVKKDSSGKIIRLTQPATWAACRHNPTITKEDWVKVEPVMTERKTECETIVVKNLDLVEKVEAGELDKMEGEPRAVIKNIREVFQPLKPSGGNFCAKLGKDGTLTDVQSRFSQKIESEYNSAIRAELRAGMKPKDDPNKIGSIDIVRFMFLETIDETLWTYRMLVDEASRSLERTLPAMNWSAETLAKIEPERKALAASADATARTAQMRALLDKLTLQERRALLAKTIETRAKP